MIKPIIRYLDYRAWLHDYYEARRAEDGFFSYRYMARKVGMDHGYLVKLLQQKVHIAEGHIGKFTEFCGLAGREAEYFAALVHFNKSRNPEESALLFEKVLALAGLETRAVEKDKFEFYTAWYHSAIRALLGHLKFKGDCGDLGRKLSPPVPEEQVRASLGLLERLELVRKDPSGEYAPTDALITTGPGMQAAAVRRFQREMLRLAHESLARHPKERRDISSVTISLDAADLESARDRIAALRQAVMNLASKSARPGAVYQLNVQLFPLSRIGGT